MNKHNYVAIMAGGIGSRFWPMSRTNYPKQFLDILNTGKTLIQWTYERFATFIPEENIFVITSKEYEGIVKSNCQVYPKKIYWANLREKTQRPALLIFLLS
jgi:mannose-1-phosphate guanylyltransferase